MCCTHSICILAPSANVSANLIFHPTPNVHCEKCIIILCPTNCLTAQTAKTGELLSHP